MLFCLIGVVGHSYSEPTDPVRIATADDGLAVNCQVFSLQFRNAALGYFYAALQIHVGYLGEFVQMA